MSLKIRSYREDDQEKVSSQSQDPKAMLQQYVGDMLMVDRQLLEAIKQQSQDEHVTRYESVKPFLEKVRGTLIDQTAELDKHLATLGGGQKQARFKETLAKAAGQVAGAAGRIRASRVSKALRDDYTALSMAAVGYEMLHTTALALKEDETADIALRHLSDIAPIIVELNQVVPEVVLEELADQGKSVDLQKSKEAVENINTAWRKAEEPQSGP